MSFVVQGFIDKFKDCDYTWFDKELPYNLNIFAVRNPNRGVNEFDDDLFCVYRDFDKKWQIKQWPVTTDPGLKTLLNPINTKGTAILVPGQYRSAYKIDLHRGQYPALCQRLAPVDVYRDSNKDAVHDLDYDSIDTGMFGINIHKAGVRSVQVDGWSAGCTVFSQAEHFDEFMQLCSIASSYYGNSFTYTLFG